MTQGFPVNKIHSAELSEETIFGQVLANKIHRHQVSEYTMFERCPWIKLLMVRLEHHWYN
jgi:hypothetical protein